MNFKKKLIVKKPFGSSFQIVSSTALMIDVQA